MFLKYEGKHSPIALYKLEGKNQAVRTGDVFECPADYAAELCARYNKEGRPPMFVEAEKPEKKARKPKMSDPKEFKAEAIE
jgi:hypothetical protein